MIVARYRQPLVVAARRLLGKTGGDPEDVVQEAFLRAFLALSRDRRPMALRSWLHCVVRNCAIDELRRVRAAALEEERGTGDETVRCAESRSQMSVLLAAMMRLPERQREALVLTVIRDQSYAAVADELGLSISAVKALISRARRGLRADVDMDTARAA
ncbi:MAG: polymerase sigma factor [Solirubrobacterales bacterium]|nr:polymerase sigma factor [Solirubrobacterales bacterium]